MSLLKSNSVQIGQSATATQNFTLSVPSSPDGTIKLARGNSGATTADILSINASGVITGSTFSGATITGATITGSTVNGGSITSGTAVASTSGTAIDFTGIPSWVKRITVMFNGVSLSGADDIIVQIGAGSNSATGYGGSSSYASTGLGFANYTTGFGIKLSGGAASSISGSMIIFNVDAASFIWSESLAVGDSSVGSIFGGGTKTLAGTLDRIRITTVGGTDTFDAGKINIMYEG
jgi:hypothetical protein